MKINTRHLGTVEVIFDDLSADVQEYVVKYGLKQTIDDAGADPKKAAKGSQERLDALLAGEVPSFGTRERLAPEVRILREVVEAVLRKNGVKAAEAAKMAKEPEAAILTLSKGDEAKAARNMAKIQKKVEEELARQDNLSVDLD